MPIYIHYIYVYMVIYIRKCVSAEVCFSSLSASGSNRTVVNVISVQIFVELDCGALGCLPAGWLFVPLTISLCGDCSCAVCNYSCCFGVTKKLWHIMLQHYRMCCTVKHKMPTSCSYQKLVALTPSLQSVLCYN